MVVAMNPRVIPYPTKMLYNLPVLRRVKVKIRKKKQHYKGHTAQRQDSVMDCKSPEQQLLRLRTGR